MAIFKVTGSIHSVDGWIYTRTHVTEAVSEKEAKNHFAWNYVVRKNPDAEFPFGKIDFKNIKVMKGEVKMENVSLWKILKAKLEGRNIPVTDGYAKELRKQFKVYRTNIDNEKLIDKISEYVIDENKKKEEKAMEVKESANSANMSMIEIIVNMLLKHGVTVNHPEDKDDYYFVYTQKGECEITAKNALLMGRDLYKHANVLFNQFHANYFKGELIKLFKPAEGNDNVVTCENEIYKYYGEGDGHINKELLDCIDSTMENQDHVLDSTWSQRKFNVKTELSKEPVNMYPAHIYDPVNQREEDCMVRFMRCGDKFIGTICFRPEGWKVYSDVRGDFKNRFKTTWEFEPRRYKSPIIRVRKQAGDDIYGLGGNERVDATLRTIYKLLVQWKKDEIRRKEIREVRMQHRINRRYVDGKKK